METFKIKDLDQLKLISDPIKLKILQSFAEGEKTVKDLADELDERLTRLYRHVDALHEAGLLIVTRETPKRGTVERTFRAVAQRFEVEQTLLADDEDDGFATIREVLRGGEREILQALNGATEDENIMVTRLRLKGSPEKIEALFTELADWVENVQQDDEDGDDTGLVEAGAMIAFYPIRET